MRACHGWRRPGSALCIPTPCLPPGTFAFLPWQLSGAVGTARNEYSCSHTWNVVVGEAVGWCAELNSCLLYFKFWLRLMTRNSLGFWMWSLGLDTEAGVIKKPRAQSPEIPISVCRPVSLAETLWPPVAPPGWRKLSLLPWVEHSGVAALHLQFGPFGGFHIWWRCFQHSFCSCSSKLIPPLF